jgi:hypothetical protein
VPIELRQAYPDGRLKSHCTYDTSPGKMRAVRLSIGLLKTPLAGELRSPLGRSGVPLIERASPPGWWDQSQVIQAFDRMLAEQVRSSLFRTQSLGWIR